jgi:hypothetical protein
VKQQINITIILVLLSNSLCGVLCDEEYMRYCSLRDAFMARVRSPNHHNYSWPAHELAFFLKDHPQLTSELYIKLVDLLKLYVCLLKAHHMNNALMEDDVVALNNELAYIMRVCPTLASITGPKGATGLPGPAGPQGATGQPDTRDQPGLPDRRALDHRERRELLALPGAPELQELLALPELLARWALLAPRGLRE